MYKENRSAVLIRQIHTEWEKNANNLLRKDDLTLSQINVLMELDKTPGNQMELKEMERRLHVAQSTTAGIVHRLEQKGFVEIFPSAEDRRVKFVRITPEGKRCCDNARVNMRSEEEHFTAALTQEEQAQLTALLQKVWDSFR